MRFLVAVLAGLLSISTASAQSILDDIEAQITGRADELARAERLLADPDPNRRIAAMEALLGSGDPDFVRKAREVGLFSDDSRLRMAAIRAILDAGGTFRAEFLVPTDQTDVTNIYGWLQEFDGSWSQDSSIGYFAFTLGRYDPGNFCWLWHNSDYCALLMAGEEVATANWRDSPYTGSAVMRLDDAGALAGPFLVNGEGIPVMMRIPLID